MFPSPADVDGALGVLRRAAACVEPDELLPDQAARLAAQLAQVIHTATAALAIVAERAGESTRWRSQGSRSVADWIARTSGLGFGDATRIVDTSQRLRANPGATLGHLRRGTISAAAANEALVARDAADARHRRDAERAAEEARRALEDVQVPDDLFDDLGDAVVCPPAPQGSSAADVEEDMLKTAQQGNVNNLRSKGREHKSAAADDESRRKAQLLYRFWRERHHDDGSGGGEYKLPAEQAALANALIREEADRLHKQRLAAGVRDLPFEALLADAFCSLLGMPLPSDIPGPTPAATPEPKAKVVQSPAPEPRAPEPTPTRKSVVPLKPKLKARIDGSALLRGRTAPGERCEVQANSQPTFLDVAALTGLLAQSNLFLVIRDDTKTISVAHLGKKRPPGTPDHLNRAGPDTAQARGILRVHRDDLAPKRHVPIIDLPGVGPVCLPALQRLLGTRLALLAEQRAVDVQNHTVAEHDFPVEIKIAAEEDQHWCTDCGSPYNLEHDHNHPHATGGPTSLANDVLRCRPDHRTKTNREATDTIRAGLQRKRERKGERERAPAQ